jgi:hypothetical protein
MGRKPIGEAAMSSTERQRRHWARKLNVDAAPKPPAAESVKRNDAEIEGLRGENARLRGEVSRLQAAAAKAAKPAKPREQSEIEKGLRTQITNERSKSAMLAGSADEAHRALDRFRRDIRKALHPDTTQDAKRKAVLEAAFQIVSPLLDAKRH